jgi:DNA-binding PadR family transcriptional regulator
MITTTGYAILGVLAIKPRTAYELATEMRHCFEYYWPRADARVYADAKQLAVGGYASGRKATVGKRPRTTYAITPKGRRALQRWLAAPSRSFGLEFEGLIKVYLARLGTREQLLRTLERTVADAEYALHVAANVRQAYLDRCAPFQDEYVHVWVMVYDFLSSFFRFVHDWAVRSRDLVAGWSDLDPAGKREAALALFEAKRAAAWIQPQLDLRLDGVPTLPGWWAAYERRTRGETANL